MAAAQQPRTLHEQVSRGERAKAILETDIVVESLKLLKISAYQTWRMTDPKDVQGREFCFHMNTAIERFEEALTKVLTDGMIAAEEIAEQRRESERTAESPLGDHTS